ncbi:hypothetical protein EI94DRAFT_1754288 [Lactarius quietus]|nr:hypothetical protein EI94DRAFT_1754288 [Lactarius quietus]
MGTEQTLRQIPKFEFRVLVVGRANAGKTSILQQVCETTESPTIYRGRKVVKLNPSVNRGEHKIDDTLVFSNHEGYVFHDSMGIESGSAKELETLKEFIQRKCGEKKLQDKLHAIWYCVPMDNHRPELDLKFYDKICPDPNVPVIAVFTKYDQFLRNVKMDVSDYPDKYPDSNGDQVAEKLFQDHYLRPLGTNAKYVRLEKMHMKDSRCDSLVEETAAALNEDTVALMLLAVQRGNIELSVKTALSRVHRLIGHEVKPVIRNLVRNCLVPFPYIYASFESWDEFDFEMEKDNFSELELFNCGNFSYDNDLNKFHATFLRPSNERQSALSQAGQNYQGANMDSMIQEYLKEFSPEDTVEKFAGFIMATDIGLFILLSVTPLSDQSFSATSVFH